MASTYPMVLGNWKKKKNFLQHIDRITFFCSRLNLSPLCWEEKSWSTTMRVARLRPRNYRRSPTERFMRAPRQKKARSTAFNLRAAELRIAFSIYLRVGARLFVCFCELRGWGFFRVYSVFTSVNFQFFQNCRLPP